MAGKYNIYTLVEFHQDVFSEKFCCDGVPVWAIPKHVYSSFPEPISTNKMPYDNTTGFPKECSHLTKGWATYYFSLAVNRAFGSLWNNKYKLLDKFT